MLIQKGILSCMLMGLSALALVAQPTVQSPKEKIIQVTGSAEMEVEPDEAYLSINLREYISDKTKHKLDEIDRNFRKVLDELKIDLKHVTIESVSGYHDWDYWRNKHTDFMASKTYLVKLPDMSKYNVLMEKLDMNGIQSVYLQKTDHSKIEEYRKKVKIDALKAAKEKARLLLESIGEQLGEVIFVRENNQNYYPMYKNIANMAMDTGAQERGATMNAGLQKIKLRYEVEAHFKIK